MVKIKILLLATLLFFQATENKKYTLDNHEIDLTLDNNWEYQKISGDTYSFKFKCDKDVIFCRNITIKVIKNTSNETIDQLTETLKEYIPKRFERYKIVSVRDQIINKRQFRVIDYKVIEENVALGNTTLITKRGNEFISIYFSGLNQPEGSYVNERKLLFEVLGTLEIREK